MIMAAIAVVGAIVSFMGQSAAAKNQQTVNRANIYAQKTVAQANNELEVSRTALSNFIREEGNKKLMQKAGEDYNAIGQNLNRASDAFTRGSIQQRTQAAEYLGSIAATSSFLGVSGSTVDTINSTLRRTLAVSQAGEKKNRALQRQDMQAQRYNQISNAVAGSNMGQTVARLQNTIIPEPYVAKPTWLNLVGDFVGNYAALGGTFGNKGGATNGTRLGGGNIV